MDSLSPIFSSAGVYSALPVHAAAAGGSTGAAATGRTSGGIPLDPFTGLPLVSPRLHYEMIVARALFEWHLQVISAVRGESGASIAFSATSAASLQAVEGLVRGEGFAEAQDSVAAASRFTAGLGSQSSQTSSLLAQYFSPGPSARRVVGYGIEALGLSQEQAIAGLTPGLLAGRAAVGSGAGEVILLALSQTEYLSFRYLELYAAGGTPGSGTGAEAFSLISLDFEYFQEQSLIAGSYSTGTPGGGYLPYDRYA